MSNEFRQVINELDAGNPVVVSTIIRQDGSSPRSMGTRFLVKSDQSLIGSIGGGRLEADVIDQSVEMTGRDEAVIVEIRMTGKDVAETDMICGGIVDVLVQALTPEGADSGSKAALAEAALLLENGGQGIWAVGPLPNANTPGRAELYFYRPGSPLIGTQNNPDMAAGALESIIDQNAARLIGGRTSEIISTEFGEFFLEPLISDPMAVIYGGGHISVKLAPLLTTVGFNLVVVDDRPEYSNTERFPWASRTLATDYRQCFDEINAPDQAFHVIVTRGHLHDKTVLEGLLARPFRYIGMIGSRRKRAMIYDALLKDGVDPDLLQKVHSPIGLSIGAETPEEIAVSIAAEMISVRSESLKILKTWKV